MAQGAHVGRVIKWNHPSHPHPITLLDALTTYGAYEGKWRCDVCKRLYDAKRASAVAGSSYRDSDDPDHRHFYHCTKCNFDVCTLCFRGHIHTFHNHRLKKARATIIYTDPDALWHCDACKVVHSEHTDQLCYHCEKCEIDLCSTCFEGKWDHILHADMPDHSLRPVDPRIEYRAYQEWMCDNCDRAFSCRRSEDKAFHCGKCNFDLCETCFAGEKHHLHLHPMVELQSKDGSVLYCSNCEKQIHQQTYYYHCRKQSCHYFLCVDCFSKQPERHPYHSHPLHVSDPMAVYPQSGGMWHCDQCTSNSLSRQPVPLSFTETMYHCAECEFDLCHSCYSEGLRGSSSVQGGVFRPVQVAEDVSYTVAEDVSYTPVSPSTPHFSYDSSGYGTYQPYTQTTYYTSQDYRSRISRPLVTGFQTFLPQLHALPHKLCRVCQRSEATSTFSHRGIPHPGPPLCCHSCAVDIVSNRRPCPDCSIPPDDVFHVPTRT
jgi:hypothetical protein